MKYDLITGGAGFIGSHLVEKILKETQKGVIVIDDLSTGKLENLPKSEKVYFIKDTILNENTLKNIFESFDIEKIYHLGAVVSVQKSVENPIETHKVNFDASLKLLNLAKKHNVKTFIFASSAAVYGDLEENPKKEDMPCYPISPYGIDKFSAERYTSLYSYLYGMNSVSFRFFNVYGERQDPSSPYSGVISIFVERIKQYLSGKDVKITIYGDGKQTRDFVYVKDVVNAVFYISSLSVNGEVYNIGTGKQTSLLELLQILESLVGKIPPVEFVNKRKGDIRYSYSDITKLKKAGYTPRYTLKEGLKNLLTYEDILSE